MSLFTKIINREIEAKIVWESATHLAFLDIKPIQDGHTLVIPKKEVDYIFDMEENDYVDLMLASKEVAKLLKSKLNCARVCVIIEGYAIPHAHVHLIPTNSEDDLKKENRRRDIDETNMHELEGIYQKIIS